MVPRSASEYAQQAEAILDLIEVTQNVTDHSQFFKPLCDAMHIPGAVQLSLTSELLTPQADARAIQAFINESLASIGGLGAYVNSQRVQLMEWHGKNPDLADQHIWTFSVPSQRALGQASLGTEVFAEIRAELTRPPYTE